MKKRFVIFIVAAMCAICASAEPDNGKFLASNEKASVGNMFIELYGTASFPLPFYNASSKAMTGMGGGVNLGIGYNLSGWLLGFEYSRDMWSVGKNSESLMKYFNSNLFSFKVQRVISKNTVKVFPYWLSLVPGASIGINLFGTEYYRSKKAKDLGIPTKIPEFSKDGITFYMRFSFEVSFPFMEMDYFIPYIGLDYNMFFDSSFGGGLAGFPRIMLGFRTYPFSKWRTPKNDDAESKTSKSAEVEILTDMEDGKFTPDGDGVNDTATFTIKTKNMKSAPGKWSMEIHDTEGHLVRQWGGNGKLPKSVVWDGLDADGHSVTSANTYTINFEMVTGGEDAKRTGQESVTAETSIRTGVIMQEIVPKKQWRIVSAPIAFDPDAATFDTISEERRRNNERIVTDVAQHIAKVFPDADVLVEGYANNVSNTEREDIEELIPISQIRADVIMEMLIENGIKSGNISAKGMGGKNPIAAWEDTANWWRNRRVEFIVTEN